MVPAQVDLEEDNSALLNPQLPVPPPPLSLSYSCQCSVLGFKDPVSQVPGSSATPPAQATGRRGDRKGWASRACTSLHWEAQGVQATPGQQIVLHSRGERGLLGRPWPTRSGLFLGLWEPWGHSGLILSY